jgi:hypothetical protein
MIVRLKKGILKKYGFHVGGDMSESVGIAVGFDGKILTYQEMKKTSHSVKIFHVCEEELEYSVSKHDNPIGKREFESFKNLYVEVKNAK